MIKHDKTEVDRGVLQDWNRCVGDFDTSPKRASPTCLKRASFFLLTIYDPLQLHAQMLRRREERKGTSLSFGVAFNNQKVKFALRPHPGLVFM